MTTSIIAGKSLAQEVPQKSDILDRISKCSPLRPLFSLLCLCQGRWVTVRLVRCVHTMPRGRMQHTAALPRGKSCSSYAANAIAST